MNTPKVEAFYWGTITLSQMLGTSPWRLDGGRHGPRLCRRRRRFLCGLGTFGCGLLLDEDFQGGPIRVAFILTRPLGATVRDFLDKPHDHGGLALSRPIASLVIVALVLGVFLLPQRPGVHPGLPEQPA